MLEWYNLIFNLAFVALLMYGFVAVTGIIGDTGDVHVGDHDIGGHDVGDHHGGEGGHHEGAHGGLWGFRGLFGRNRAPMSLIIMIALVLWGGSGLSTNVILDGRLHQNAWWVLVSILAA